MLSCMRPKRGPTGVPLRLLAVHQRVAHFVIFRPGKSLHVSNSDEGGRSWLRHELQATRREQVFCSSNKYNINKKNYNNVVKYL